MDKKILNLLLAHAYKLISRRSQSEKEFTQKLTRYMSKKAISDRDKYLIEVINRLKELNLINDPDFAKWYVEQRADFRPRSKRMLTFELSQKGIDRGIIEETLESYDEKEAITKIISKKGAMERKKLISYFLARGFSWEKITEVIGSQSA